MWCLFPHLFSDSWLSSCVRQPLFFLLYVTVCILPVLVTTGTRGEVGKREDTPGGCPTASVQTRCAGQQTKARCSAQDKGKGPTGPDGLNLNPTRRQRNARLSPRADPAALSSLPPLEEPCLPVPGPGFLLFSSPRPLRDSVSLRPMAAPSLASRALTGLSCRRWLLFNLLAVISEPAWTCA